jgi:hypothetical protein
MASGLEPFDPTTKQTIPWFAHEGSEKIELPQDYLAPDVVRDHRTLVHLVQRNQLLVG